MASRLSDEVEQLRLKLTAAQEGREYLVPPPAPVLRANSVADFWTRTYEAAHGAADDGFTKKDGVLLDKLAKAFPPSERLGFMIEQFHREQGEWLEEGGWSVAQFVNRVRGLNLRYVKEVQEPKLKDEKRELQRALEEFAKQPGMADALDAIGVPKK